MIKGSFCIEIDNTTQHYMVSLILTRCYGHLSNIGYVIGLCAENLDCLLNSNGIDKRIDEDEDKQISRINNGIDIDQIKSFPSLI